MQCRRGVEKNIDKSLEYYKQAAEAGNLAATMAMSRVYRKHKNWLVKKGSVPIYPISFCLFPLF
jgi:TPR repeat protein